MDAATKTIRVLITGEGISTMSLLRLRRAAELEGCHLEVVHEGVGTNLISGNRGPDLSTIPVGALALLEYTTVGGCYDFRDCIPQVPECLLFTTLKDHGQWQVPKKTKVPNIHHGRRMHARSNYARG